MTLIGDRPARHLHSVGAGAARVERLRPIRRIGVEPDPVLPVLVVVGDDLGDVEEGVVALGGLGAVAAKQRAVADIYHRDSPFPLPLALSL